MWFTQQDDHIDDHGYYCCSGCVTQVVKLSGVRRKHWYKLYQPKDYQKYPMISWYESKQRTLHLLRHGAAPVYGEQSEGGDKDEDKDGDASSGVVVETAFTRDEWDLVAPTVIKCLNPVIKSVLVKNGVDDSVITPVMTSLTPPEVVKHLKFKDAKSDE